MSQRIVLLGHQDGWLGAMWSDIRKYDDVKIWNRRFPTNNEILTFIARVHFSDKINRVIRIPGTNLWNRYFADQLSKDKESPLLIIVYDHCKLGYNECFLKYLRKTFKNLKLVYVMTNEFRYTSAGQKDFLAGLHKYYDMVYGFHIPDGEQYGFKIVPLVYSKVKISGEKKRPVAFYAGRGKDRLQGLLDVQQRIRSLGFNTDFNIIDVDKKDIKRMKGVRFNHPLNYSEVVERTVRSSCLLEIPQGIMEAFSIKVCEAIFYDCLLITTNKLIKEAPFYDERYMLYIEKPEDITKEFLSRWNKVHYKKEARDYFSVERFLNTIFEDVGWGNVKM